MTWLALLLAATPVASDHVEAGALIAIPHVALRVSDREPLGGAVSLPWTLRLVTAPPRPFVPRSLIIEPGVVFGKEVAFRGRLGFRWSWDPVSWLSAGVGFGIAGEFGAEELRVAPSPELVVRVGRGPIGYGALFGRLEPQLDGSVVGYVGLGYTFW